MRTDLPVAVVVSAAIAACSVPPVDSRYTPLDLPPAASFPPVAELLDVRCGSLDCHGTVARNLRIFGSAGLRWSPADRPLVPPCEPPDEVAQDYESVVDLEPETMNAVVAGGGQDPEMLAMVRKARGTESHKGGQIWSKGDESDTCLVSWLAGATDAGACERAVQNVLPGGASNPLVGCLKAP